MSIFLGDDFWRVSVSSSWWFDSGFIFVSVYRGADGPRILRSVHFALEILTCSTSPLFLAEALGRISHFYLRESGFCVSPRWLLEEFFRILFGGLGSCG